MEAAATEASRKAAGTEAFATATTEVMEQRVLLLNNKRTTLVA